MVIQHELLLQSHGGSMKNTCMLSFLQRSLKGTVSQKACVGQVLLHTEYDLNNRKWFYIFLCLCSNGTNGFSKEVKIERKLNCRKSHQRFKSDPLCALCSVPPEDKKLALRAVLMNCHSATYKCKNGIRTYIHMRHIKILLNRQRRILDFLVFDQLIFRS